MLINWGLSIFSNLLHGDGNKGFSLLNKKIKFLPWEIIIDNNWFNVGIIYKIYIFSIGFENCPQYLIGNHWWISIFLKKYAIGIK